MEITIATTRTGSLPRLITPGILWVGGCLEYPYRGERVHSHMSAFLIKGSKKSVIIDTGNPHHYASVLLGARKFLDGRPLDYVFPTHYEWPHAGLLPNWMEEYPDAVLVGDLPETDLYYPEFVDRLKSVQAGDRLDLGDRELVFVPAIWRDVQTLWAFDTKDRALFVSDAFAYFHHHHEGECDLTSSEQPLADPKMVQFSGDLTMGWTRYTDTGVNISEIVSLLDMLKPEIICPAHGTVIDRPADMIPRLNRDG